jgi:hypothetical protein
MAGPSWGPDADGYEVSSFYEGRFTSFPLLRMKPGKIPMGRGWSSMNRKPAELGPWRKRLIGYHGPLAAVMGAGFGVLDVDLDVDGAAESYAELAGRCFELVDIEVEQAPTVRTPSGGVHKYFRVKKPLRSGPIKGFVGVDFKCEGGFVMVPPSDGYRWEDG